MENPPKSRLYSSLILFYKIRAQTVVIDNYYIILTRNINYLIPQSRIQYFAISYFPRTIRLWNSFPNMVKFSPSIDILIWKLAGVKL